MAGQKKILIIGSASMDLSMNVYKMPEKSETVTEELRIHRAERAQQQRLPLKK